MKYLKLTTPHSKVLRTQTNDGKSGSVILITETKVAFFRSETEAVNYAGMVHKTITKEEFEASINEAFASAFNGKEIQFNVSIQTT